MAYNNANKIFGEFKVNKIRRMCNQKKHSVWVCRGFTSYFIHKKKLELRVQMKFRFIYKKAAVSRTVKCKKKREDSFKAVAFSFLKAVFNSGRLVYHNRNIAVFFKADRLSEHV